MKYFAYILGAVVLGTTAAQADVVNRRNQCDRWEYIPQSEQLGNAPAALLFCDDSEKYWMALHIECRVDPVNMVIHYRPGFEFTPPEKPEREIFLSEDGTPLSEEDQLAAELVAAIPYEDSGIKPLDAGINGAREMVFMDFRSFGYTSVAEYEHDTQTWVFEEKEPLSPMFSRLISGNYADIKLLAYGTTERFPLRGSGKALSPVVETCRKAKRAAARAKN